MTGGDQNAMGGGSGDAHRRGPSKTGLASAFQRRVHTLFVSAFKEAGPGTIRQAAKILGVSHKTVSAWIQGGRDVTVPAYRLMELMSSDEILPEIARERFVRGLCAEMGFYAVPIPEAKGGGTRTERELMDVVEEVGVVAGKVRAGLADGTLSRSERAGLIEEIVVLGVQVAELGEAVKAQ